MSTSVEFINVQITKWRLKSEDKDIPRKCSEGLWST